MSVINISCDFIGGYKSAIQEVKDGDTYDIPSALASFVCDQPDTDYQRGYLLGLKNVYQGRRTN